jgi:hypothetical protein
MSITYPITGVNTYYQNLRTIHKKGKKTKNSSVIEKDLYLCNFTLQILPKNINLNPLTSQCTYRIASEMLQRVPHPHHNSRNPCLINIVVNYPKKKKKKKKK